MKTVDNEFPRDMFDAIEKAKMEIKRDGEQSVSRDSELENLKGEIAELEQEREKEYQAMNDGTEEALANEEENLEKQKQTFINQIRKLENDIALIKQQLAEKINPEQITNSLAFMQSIAPIKITRITGNSVTGVIAGGTPDTTKLFDIDITDPTRAAERFWEVLQDVYHV